MSKQTEAKKVVFSGRVQGVGFRFTALNIANRYDLNGYVRNMPDGTVEMVAQGHPDDINDCIRDIQESFAGHLRDTDISDIAVNPELSEFKITF